MARVPRTGTDIVGIEQEGVVRVKRLVVLTMFAEQKLFEEPGRMGAVPFRGTCVRHGLDELVFRAQERRAALCLVADSKIGFHEILGEGAGIRGERCVGGKSWGRGGCWFRHVISDRKKENVAVEVWFQTGGPS